jgi:ribA/ribD-fused uncharacterized protein
MRWRSEAGTLHDGCAVFFTVDGEFGGLSNMAGGYPLRVGGVPVGSSEALYQACRFPHRPEWQQEIISQASPMAAKMKAKKEHRRQDHSRPDWPQAEVEVMRWVLRVKLAQHYGRVARLLLATGGRPIVERSRKDRFWGAVEGNDGVLCGRNQLGLLLVQLRGLLESRPPEELQVVAPPPLPNFLLLGRPVEAACAWGGEPRPWANTG